MLQSDGVWGTRLLSEPDRNLPVCVSPGLHLHRRREGVCGCVRPTVDFSGLRSLKLASLLAQLLTGQDGEGMTRPRLPLIGSPRNSNELIYPSAVLKYNYQELITPPA